MVLTKRLIYWWDGRGLMLWLLSSPLGFAYWICFCCGIQFYVLLSHYLCFFSFLYLDIYVFGDDALIKLGVIHEKTNIYVSWSTSELRLRLVPWNWLKPFSKIFLLTVPRQYFFCWSFMLLCSVFLLLSHLFIAALWSPAGKGLVMFIVFLLLSNVVSWVRCGTW